jgi:hypothetical protein
MPAQIDHSPHWLSRAAAVATGALFLSWPAFYNGFPLLYGDSMTYLDDGPTVARALFLHSLSDYYGVRSFFYSLGILPWHWNHSAWPIVALQCLLVSWVVWLVVRSVAPRRPIANYLAVVAFLSLLTSAGWYASFIMPDVLGPLLYLSIYLLVFAEDTLSRAERMSLYPIAWWSATAHATHLLLAAGLCVLLALIAVWERKSSPGRLRGVGQAAAIVAVAAAAQMALHGYLYGKPTLNGERPPYLMARMIVDGPAKMYLEKNCNHLQWTICGHIKDFAGDADEFLWNDGGIYQSGSDADRAQLLREEMPLAVATFRAYPREQFSMSWANFTQQLFAFGLYGFDPSPWILAEFNHVLPSARASYMRSRQATDALPLDLLTDIQWWTVAASLAAIVTLIPLLWRRHSRRVAGLGLVIVPMVVLNALVTGVLSVVDDRYGCRVIWLVPLLAALLLLDWLHQREAAEAESKAKAAQVRVAVPA